MLKSILIAAGAALAVSACGSSGALTAGDKSALSVGVVIAAPVATATAANACATYTSSAALDTLCFDLAGDLISVAAAKAKGELAQ